MDTSKRTKTNGVHKDYDVSSVTDEAQELIHEGKKITSNLYQQSMDSLDEAQEMVKQYSNKVWHKAHDNPLTTTVILGGVLGGLGVLLYSLLKKK